MFITIDLSQQAGPASSVPMGTPEGLLNAVCGNFAMAVQQLAQQSRLAYSLDTPTLQRVLALYLDQHPTHNNPFNLVLREANRQAEAEFYDFRYRFEGMPFSSIRFKNPPPSPLQRQGVYAHIPELGRSVLVNGKMSYASGEVHEGRFEYIPELQGMGLVEGKITTEDGDVQEGRFEYIPELEEMGLVEGKSVMDANVHEGRFAYIAELEGMCLVDGKIIMPGTDVFEGRFEYIPELEGMSLVEGKSTSAIGRVSEGRFEYIPDLGAVLFVEGKLTAEDGQMAVGRWAYDAAVNDMRFVSDMASRLEGWVRDGDESEDRAEAAQRMDRAHADLSRRLDLVGLNLKALPQDIRQMVHLQGLDLSDNQLATLPSCIGELSQLKILVVCNNPHLADLPEAISNLQHIQAIDLLNCSSLRHWPVGFERLPAGALVNLEGTGLSVNVLEVASRAVEVELAQSGRQRGPQILFSLPAQATRDVMSLAEEMLEWFKEVNPGEPARLATLQRTLDRHIRPEASHAMATLLMRFRKTGQYAFAPQLMAERVVALLNGLLEQPSLLDIFCEMALESTETCDDRTALGMLNMELALLENQALKAAMQSSGPKRDTFLQLFEVGKGVFKQRALMDIAYQHAQRAGGYVDETEMVLKYVTHLGADLQLPVQWGHMLYERFAFQVTDDDLRDARARLVDTANLANPEFLSFMRTWHPFHAVIRKLEPQVCEEVESDLRMIQQRMENEQERLFDEYEQVCRQHGVESPEALGLVTAMNKNATKLTRHSEAMWRHVMAWCLGQGDGSRGR